MVRDDAIVRVTLPNGVAHVRDDYAHLNWSALEYRGTDAALRPIYAVQDRRSPVIPLEGASDELLIVADAFPPIAPDPDLALRRHLELADRASSAHSVLLPTYLAAVPSPNRAGPYVLVSTYARRTPFRIARDTWLGDSDFSKNLLWLFDAAYELHERGVFHYRGFDMDHVMIRSHPEAAYPCDDDFDVSHFYMPTNNWDVEHNDIRQLTPQALWTFALGFFLEEGRCRGAGVGPLILDCDDFWSGLLSYGPGRDRPPHIERIYEYLWKKYVAWTKGLASTFTLAAP